MDYTFINFILAELNEISELAEELSTDSYEANIIKNKINELIQKIEDEQFEI